LKGAGAVCIGFFFGLNLTNSLKKKGGQIRLSVLTLKSAN